MALERTGSKSPQIADLLYCITFQRTNQDRLRIGPFQSPSFSSSMRCKKLEGSGYEVGGPLDNQTSQTEWKTTPLAKVQLCEHVNQTLEGFVADSRSYVKLTVLWPARISHF